MSDDKIVSRNVQLGDTILKAAEEARVKAKTEGAIEVTTKLLSDIEAVDSAASDLQKISQHLRDLVQSLKDGTFEVDNYGRIIYKSETVVMRKFVDLQDAIEVTTKLLSDIEAVDSDLQKISQHLRDLVRSLKDGTFEVNNYGRIIYKSETVVMRKFVDLQDA